VYRRFLLPCKGRLIKQISAEELARESRRYILIRTNGTEKVISLLKAEFKIADWEQSGRNEECLVEEGRNDEALLYINTVRQRAPLATYFSASTCLAPKIEIINLKSNY
jgi:hypothetical protein